MKTNILITFLALSLLTSSRAALVTTPVGQTSLEGNANNAAPFNISAFQHPSMRYQQIYAASAFSALLAGGEFITRIAFRPDTIGSGHAFNSTLPGIRIDLSTASVGPDGLSVTFASNVGLDDIIVYGGISGAPLTLSSSYTGPAGGPKDFDIIINLTTPFFYDPAVGNLLLDVRNFDGGFTAQFDAQTTTGDSVSRVDSTDVNSTTGGPGRLDTLGLVTRFTTSTVPEPTSASLLGLGALLLAARRRRSA